MDYSKNLSDNIKALLEARDISLRAFALNIGVSPSTFIDALKSKRGLSIELAIKCSDALRVPVEFLAKKSTVEILCNEFRARDMLSSSELQLVTSFSGLNDEGQEKVLVYIEDLCRTGIYKRDYSVDMGAKQA